MAESKIRRKILGFVPGLKEKEPAKKLSRKTVEADEVFWTQTSARSPRKVYARPRASFKNLISRQKVLLLAIAAGGVQGENGMWQQFQPVLGEPAEWLGDWHPLVEQLGSANGLVALCDVSASMQIPLVHDLPSLRRFLEHYQSQILLPHELPAVQRAFDHACRHEVRELAEFDLQLANEAALKPFADASRRVGQTELLKLRPLRDERIVKRYLEAVERGEANAWHTLVYGMTLAVYSIPLRQGLLGYGFQTTRGFIYAAARALQLSENDCRALLEQQCQGLPDAVETLIAQRAAA